MPRSPVPRPRGPQATKVDPDRILFAAQKVFGAMGVQGASIRAIAQEAGCDPALLYYHFESKEGLFRAVLEKKFKPSIQEFQAVLEDEQRHPYLRIWELLQAFQRQVGSDAGWRDLIRGQVIHGAEPIRDIVTGYVREVQGLVWQVLGQGMASGHLRKDLKVPLVAFFFMRTYTEILDLIPVFAERIAGMPAEQALALAQREWMAFFWRGVAADPFAPVPDLPEVELP